MSAKMANRLTYESQLWRQGFERVAGVDEAGCGPLAGPVVAAAVVLPSAWAESGMRADLQGLNDSKQLSEEARERYFTILTTDSQIKWTVATMNVEAIDRLNIRQAAWQGMQKALDMLEPKPQHALVDGLKIKWLRYPQTALAKGDSRSYSIAAASVLAKVTRDRIMAEFDAVYPGYGFREHKGYGTPGHFTAIQKLGPCPIHRRSFAPFKPAERELF